MPLQNRVNPEGEICFSPALGTFMGNRGCLHDDQQRIVRRSKRNAWVICLLDFKERRRFPLMKPGEYTELFFLDEATALAAGHRPCAECQRERFNAFVQAWSRANYPGKIVRAGDLDAQLADERHPDYRHSQGDIIGLPDGVFVKQTATGNFYLLLGPKAYLWSFEGYHAAVDRQRLGGPFVLLTPSSTLRALQLGYKPALHLSIDSSPFV